MGAGPIDRADRTIPAPRPHAIHAGAAWSPVTAGQQRVVLAVLLAEAGLAVTTGTRCGAHRRLRDDDRGLAACVCHA